MGLPPPTSGDEYVSEKAEKRLRTQPYPAWTASEGTVRARAHMRGRTPPVARRFGCAPLPLLLSPQPSGRGEQARCEQWARSALGEESKPGVSSGRGQQWERRASPV
eukprot:452303-Prymnesium_polylepis.2